MNTCTTRVDAVWDRYTRGSLTLVPRVDAAWFRYPDESLKNQTRVKRLGETAAGRIRVSQNVPFPKGKDWQTF